MTTGEIVAAFYTLRGELLRSRAREREALRALRWVAGNYRSTLAGKPVRDADECLERVNVLLTGRP